MVETIAEIKLKVAEAIQDDVNKGIVRIDTEFMREAGIKPGDIVEIEGERKTVAIIDRAYPSDIGLHIIRMDGIIRRNAKTAIGEMVVIRKTAVKEAKRVVIAPAKKGVFIKASANIFKQGLLGRAVVKGDIVALGGTSRRRTTMSHNPFFEDIFTSFFDENLASMGFGDLKFIVADTNPKQPVIISEGTEVDFNPEAIEVSEEHIPDITYEDIGGLDEEIKKVREMVELPLKHPEIFERLGIEAPKGVLLHGPPGTGKTMMAKAVANETNSNFILINGPEIMSKFYGQSLPGYEKVLVKENGLIKRVPIAELDHKEIEAVCFDKGGNITIRKVSGFIQHRLASRIVEVRTVSGRKIRVTDDHSLFTLGKKGIEGVKTSSLKRGSYIAVPNKIPFNSSPFYEIDVMEQLKDEDYGIRVRNVQDLLSEAVKKLGIKKAAAALGVREKYIYDIRSKNVGVGVKKYYKLMEEAGIKINKEFMQLCTKGKSFPSIMRFSEDLWLFFGLWFAEGSYTNKNEVRLSIHRDEEKIVASLCRKLFGGITIYRKKNSQGSDIYICSGILGKIMKNVLGFDSGARVKKVPSIVYNLSKEHLSAFLRGYISGDGTLNTKTPAPMVEVCTESPDLADDIAYLFLQFGIVAKIYERKGRPQKRICFSSYVNLDRFREIGFLDSRRNSIIYEYINTKKFSRRNQMPITGDIRAVIMHNAKLSAWRKSGTIGVQIIKEYGVQTYADVYWDKVIQIREIDEQPEFVYDLSVPGSESFIAGFGGIFAHNSEENLRKRFEDAEKNAPSIIFIDEIDAIAAKREEVHGEVEKRVVAQLLALMDGLKSRGKVIVIAASNIPHELDPALRRPGRFDRELEIGVPGKDGRLNILKIHTRNMPIGDNSKVYGEKEKEKVLKEFAGITHGFVGADLSALCKEAAMIVLRRVLPDLSLKEESTIPNEVLEKLIVTKDDFRESLKVVRPSALREVMVEVPNVHWQDIGGLGEVKQELVEAVTWPLKHPDAFRRLGVRPPRGVLLYGAPGTGKTLLAKAVATESESNFILVKGPELLSKWVGESEKAVRKVFEKARQTAPTIIFFDEVDALAPRRGMSQDAHVTERVVNQILTEMDGLEPLNDVLILAATNRPDMLDTALLRPGRFDRIILTPIPDRKSRLEIFKVHTKGMPLKGVKIESLAEETEGYVGADVEAVCREAAILALRKDIKAKEVSAEDFAEALKKVRASVTKDIEKSYEELQDQFKSARARQMQEEKPAYMG